MVSISLSNSTLKSLRFIPGAATSMMNSSLLSLTFTAGIEALADLQLLRDESSQSSAKRLFNKDGMDESEFPLVFTKVFIVILLSNLVKHYIGLSFLLLNLCSPIA